MYANKLAVAVKHRGKVLQEFGEIVYLPFGSEYGLLIKNLNSVRASVKVRIDGQDVTEGVALVVPPNGSIDLERFIKNGNLNAGNRFKFIERTSVVTRHRGARVDDGLIQVSWAFEVPYAPPQYIGVTGIGNEWWKHQSTSGGWGRSGSLTSGAPVTSGIARGMLGSASASSSASVGQNSAGAASWSTDTYKGAPLGAPSAGAGDAPGITAPGSVSNQQFHSVGWFPTEATTHVMVLKLAGEAATTGAVQNVVYTRSKVGCTTCGHKSRPTSNFCSQCGASLNVIG